MEILCGSERLRADELHPRRLAGMIERGWGRIVTISSESARAGDRKLAAYAASKGAALR